MWREKGDTQREKIGFNGDLKCSSHELNNEANVINSVIKQLSTVLSRKIQQYHVMSSVPVAVSNVKVTLK